MKNSLNIFSCFNFKSKSLKYNSTPYSDIWFLNICYTLNSWDHMPYVIEYQKMNEKNRMRYFFEKNILVETFSSNN